jgi:hypothetical protein
VDEVVKFVGCSHVLDMVDNGFQNIDTECPWRQLLIEGQMDDPLIVGDYSPNLLVMEMTWALARSLLKWKPA